jgi:hypothetical protein
MESLQVPTVRGRMFAAAAEATELGLVASAETQARFDSRREFTRYST